MLRPDHSLLRFELNQTSPERPMNVLTLGRMKVLFSNFHNPTSIFAMLLKGNQIRRIMFAMDLNFKLAEALQHSAARATDS